MLLMSLWCLGALVHAETTLSQEEWRRAKLASEIKWYLDFIQQTLLLAPLLSECILFVVFPFLEVEYCSELGQVLYGGL